MAENVKYPKQGGGKAAGVHIFFKAFVQSVLLFGADRWVVNHPHGTAHGWFSRLGGAVTYGADSMEEYGRKVGVNLVEGGEIRGAV